MTAAEIGAAARASRRWAKVAGRASDQVSRTSEYSLEVFIMCWLLIRVRAELGYAFFKFADYFKTTWEACVLGVLDCAHQLGQRVFGIAIEHAGDWLEEEGVFETREAFALSALQHDD